MNNIDLVTRYLSAQGIKTLHIIPAKNGKKYVGEYRMYDYILNSYTIQVCENKEQFYLNGKCFGGFYRQLRNFKEELIPSIPDFHNTKKRYEQFIEAIQLDLKGRVKDVQEEINYLKQYQLIADLKMDQSYITHNDTKLSNILFDQNTHEPICIIDLDTLMKGSIGYDYGDALRSGANLAGENEEDISLVDFDLPLFYAFSEGFIEGLKEYEPSVIDELEKGIYVIIYEQALRFLTDYLNGDTYYSISYPDHNLVRARNQIQLLRKTIEKKEMIHQYMEILRGKGYETNPELG